MRNGLRCQNREAVALLEGEARVGAQKFVNRAGGAGELGIIIVMHNDDSLFCQAGRDELQANPNRVIKITIKEGKGDFRG